MKETVQHDPMEMVLEQTGSKPRQELIRRAEAGERVFFKKILGKGILNPFDHERILYAVSWERLHILGAVPEKLERRMLGLMHRHGERLFEGEIIEILPPKVGYGLWGVRLRLWQTQVVDETINLPMGKTAEIGVRVNDRVKHIRPYDGPDVVVQYQGEPKAIDPGHLFATDEEECQILGRIVK